MLVLVASGARARDALAGGEDAEALISRGIELRERGKDDEALAVFKKALAKTPSPRARAQVALAEQALGLWVAAEGDLILALAADADAWIAKNRSALEGALAIVRRHLGSLEIRGTDGADVLLDGVRLGALPASSAFRVEAGKRTLDLRAKGFYPTTRTVEIPAGGVARETVTLVALPAGGAAGGAVGAGDVGAGAAGGARRDGGAAAERGDPGQGQRVLGWAFVGVGGALLGAGGVGLLVRSGIVDDYNSRCPGLGVGQSPDCDGKIDSARTWLTVSIISLIGGGVFALGGVTLVATAPHRQVAAAAAGTRIGCGPSAAGGAALFCWGTF